MVIMTDPMKKYILAEDKRGLNKSEYNGRIVRSAQRGLRDLTFFLEHLTEDLQSEIFNSENLNPLFRSLFNGQDAMSEEKRLRLLSVCNAALDQIRVHLNGSQLAPNAWKVLRETPGSTQDEIYGTKVILALQIENSRFTQRKASE